MTSALKMIAERMALCGRREAHDVQRTRAAGRTATNSAGMIAKYFATSLAIEKVVSAPRVISSCLPIADDLDQLGRVAVEVDHVAGLARRLRARVHGDADVGLGQRRRVVGAVAAHRDQPALRLLARGSASASPRASPRRGSRRRPASAAIAAAVSGLSPVIITVRMPMRRSSAKRSRMPPLTMSLRWTTPSTRAVARHGERRAAGLGDRRGRPASSCGVAAPAST